MKLPIPKGHITIFTLSMLTVASVLSLRGLPIIAKEGPSLIFYLIYAAIFFLIPASLVSAEMATTWTEKGGVFRWVSEAFGERFGFLAIWLQWVQIISWYPTVLAFAAGSMAYLFLSPDLAEDPYYNIAIILTVYWVVTWINSHGIKAAGWVTTFGVILGTLIPGLFIILLGAVWWLSGKPISFSGSVIPDFSEFSSISLLAGIMLLFTGIEVSSVHVKEVKNPRKSYPIAVLIAVLIIIVTFTLGGLAVGAVIPQEEISLTAGIMQAFADFLDSFGISWLLPVLGLFIAFGAIAGVAAWVIGPSRGILEVAKHGIVPPFLSHTNQQGIPTHILFIQGAIVTLLSWVYLFMPTVSSAFFLLTDLSVILYLLMYLLLFSSALYLRYKRKEVHRTFKVPGGNVGMWIVAGLGLCASAFAIFLGFIPPAQLKFGSPSFYVIFLAVGVSILTGLPFIIYQFRKPSWRTKNER